MKTVFLTLILSAGISGAYAQTNPGGVETPTNLNTNPSTITPNNNADPYNNTGTPGTPNTGMPNNSLNNNNTTTPINPSDTTTIPNNPITPLQDPKSKSTSPTNPIIGQ